MSWDHLPLTVWRYSLSSFSSSNLHWRRWSRIHCFRDWAFIQIQRKLFWQSELRCMCLSTPRAARFRWSDSTIQPCCARESSSSCRTLEPSAKSAMLFPISCNLRAWIFSFNNVSDFSNARMLSMACKALLRDWPKNYLVGAMLIEGWANLYASGFVCSCTCAAHSVRRTSSPTAHVDNISFASRFFCWQWYYRQYSQWPMPSHNLVSRKWIWLSMMSMRW